PGAGFLSLGGGAKNGAAGKAAIASLTPLVSVGAVVSIRPDESVIQMGKEFKLTISDERFRPTADGVFHLQYDPQVLEFKTILNGEVVPIADSGGKPSSGPETQAGMVAYRIAPSARQVGGRTVTVTFYAKAPGVSPVRVGLVDSEADSSMASSQEGAGIVRVR
ncbi:MAG: hypothetical protein ABIR36_10095, partial [Nitrospiraceae bacterium]